MAKKKRTHRKIRNGQRPRQKNVAFSLDKWLYRFQEAVSGATRSICERREEGDTIDVVEVIIEALFFRNCHIYETIIFLLDRLHLIGAELLLRCLFEGSVIVEWCVADPKTRAQSLQKDVWMGELDLKGKRFLKSSKESKQVLSNAILAIDQQNISGLPNFRQMVESLPTYRKGYAYNLYKYLSKKTHGVGGDPSDFLLIQSETAEVCRVKTHPPENRLFDCRAMASIVQMNNIKAISSFDRAIRYENLTELEEIWATFYMLLEAEKKV